MMQKVQIQGDIETQSTNRRHSYTILSKTSQMSQKK